MHWVSIVVTLTLVGVSARAGAQGARPAPMPPLPLTQLDNRAQSPDLDNRAFSLTFALVSLVTGWRGIYPLLVAGALCVVLLTLIFYARPIVGAMRGRFAALAVS